MTGLKLNVFRTSVVVALLALITMTGCASAQTTVVAPQSEPTHGQRQIRDGFQMELHGCIRTRGQVIECSFTVTSLRADVEWGIDADSRLVTATGSLHGVSALRLGNSPSRRGWDVSHLMVKDIPTPLLASFDEVEPSASQIGLLEIRDGTATTVFQFRNVPIAGAP